ncbi:unnamed protein product [Coccothraustes coccothraustes]
MQALRKGEDAYLELSGAKGRSRTVFSRSRALESTGTGTMLSGRRSRFFASANRRARPLLRREEWSSTTLAISAQPSNSSRTALRKAEDANLELKELRAGPELFQQEPRFGEHGHRHNAQCVKKPRLRFHQPESAASAET